MKLKRLKKFLCKIGWHSFGYEGMGEYEIMDIYKGMVKCPTCKIKMVLIKASKGFI